MRLWLGGGVMRPSAALLERLAITRLLPAHAQPSLGTGERRSRRKGAGMEFIDHRPYRAGDDTRHLDPHLFARTGDYVVREYALNQQLPVTIALDLSASMQAAEGDKLARARLIAQLFGFTALAGGDRVQIVVSGSSANLWSPRWHAINRADPMFDWIARQAPSGQADFSGALARMRAELPARGLLIAISDWWDGEIGSALDALHAAGHEVLAIQVLSPEEIDPWRMADGVVTVQDAETGEDVRLAIDAGLLGRYRKLFDQRQQQLRSQFNTRHWHFVSVSTNDEVSQLFTHTLRAQGVLS